MANPLPSLTKQGIMNLSAQLDKELARVSPGDSRLPAIQQTINQIKPLLANAVDSFPSINWGLIPQIKTLFGQLTPMLRGALGLAPTDVGACTYTTPDGTFCIVTTHTQCDALGGQFNAGLDCQGNPL
jgi:hypothetical protein